VRHNPQTSRIAPIITPKSWAISSFAFGPQAIAPNPRAINMAKLMMYSLKL